MPVKLLVTGAAGEIGQDLVPWLAERHEVRATDLVACESPCEFVQADLRDPEQVRPLVEGVEAVVHLAALLPRPHPTDEYVDANVKATALLCEAAAAAGVGRFVYASTVWATGQGAEQVEQPIDERAPWLPVETYGFTKLLGEMAVEYWARMTGMSSLLLRLCGYRRCPEVGPEGKLDLQAANLGAVAECLLRPGQKLCFPDDLGRVMEAAVLLEGVATERIIVGLHVPWHSGDVEQLRTHPLAVFEHYYPGVAELLGEYGVKPQPVEAFYSTARARRLLRFRQECTVSDVVAAHLQRRR